MPSRQSCSKPTGLPPAATLKDAVFLEAPLKAEGTYLKEMNRIVRCDLLILDDFGMQNLDNTNRMNLMEIIEDRHGRKSTLIASQLPVASWYEVIGESTIADAILHRLIHGAHRIELKGSSMRKKEKQ